MSSGVAWFVTAACCAAAFVLTVSFRRGPVGSYLAIYRNEGLPLALRQSVLIGPIAFGLLAPVIALLAIPMLGVTVPISLNSHAEGGVIFAGTGYFLSTFGASLAVASRPIDQLIPDWLSLDNQRGGYALPRPTSLDRVVGAAGIVALAIGVLCLAVSAIEFIWAI